MKSTENFKMAFSGLSALVPTAKHHAGAAATVLLLPLLLLLSQTSFGQTGTTYTANVTGNWTEAATWTKTGTATSSIYPQSGATVVINQGATVTLRSSNAACDNITIEAGTGSVKIGGKLVIGDGTSTAATLTLNNLNFRVANGQPKERANISMGANGYLKVSGAIQKVNNAGAATTTADNTDIFYTFGSGSSIEYMGASQSIFNFNAITNTDGTSTAYANLILSGSGTKTAAAGLTVTGNLDVKGSTTFVAGTYQHAIAGNLTTAAGTIVTSTAAAGSTGLAVTGTTNMGGIFNAGNGTYTFTGSVTNSGTISASNSIIQLGNSFTNTGTFTKGSGTVVYNGAAQNIAGVAYNNLTLAGTGTKTASGNLSVGSNLVVNQNITFAATGTTNLTHTITGSVTNNGTLNPTTATAANQLNVMGDFTNGATGTFNALNGTYTVTGNFTNSGTLNAGTSTVTLNGTGKTVSSNTTGSFNNLSFTGTTPSLVSNVTVNGNLQVTSSVLTTGANTLYLGPTGSYTSAEDGTAHIDGTVQTTRNLVAGSGETFGGIGLRILNSSISASNITVKRTTGTVVTSTTTSNSSVPRQYTISTTDASVSADGLKTAIEMSFPSYQLEANTTATNYDIFRSTDKVNFEKVTRATTTDPTYAFKVDNPLKFALYTISNSVTPLPVELAWFKAEPQSLGVSLNWMTASERDNSGFEVQVSTDGKAFRKIGFVQSHAITTSAAQHYSFLDDTAIGTRYYRLAQIDLNGETTYSSIRAVTITEAASVASAYPNPFRAQLTVQLPAGQQRQVQVTVANAMGQVVLQQQVALQEGQRLLPVALENAAAPGVYVLYVADQSAKHLFKLIKQ